MTPASLPIGTPVRLHQGGAGVVQSVIVDEGEPVLLAVLLYGCGVLVYVVEGDVEAI